MGNINLNLNSSLASTIQTASGLIGNVVNGFIVSPNDAPPGVSGFVFNIIGDEEIFVDSEVTDHFVEENYAVQDHVALKPISFTLKGFQGELVSLVGQSFNPILNAILALAPLTQANPQYNIQDTQVYSAIALGSAQSLVVLNQIPSLAALIGNLTTIQTQQQAAFNFFLNMRNNRQLVTIQTPYGLLTNYIIENFRARQPGDSRFMSDFTVTFKQIQVVSTSVAPTAAAPNPVGSGVQTTNVQANAANPTPASSSTLPGQTTTTNAQFPSSSTLPVANTDLTSGRLVDYTTSTVENGSTTGAATFPGTNPPVPVSLPNTFPINNPAFQTLPSMNLATPGFIPAI